MLKDFNGTYLSIIAIFILAVWSLLNFFVPSFLKDKEKQLDKKAEIADLTSIKGELDEVKDKVDKIPNEIETKLNERDKIRTENRGLREQILKSWTSNEIVKAIKELGSDIKENIDKVSADLQKQICEMEIRSDKKLEKMEERIDGKLGIYKKNSHDKLDKAAGFEGATNICIEALKEANKAMSLAKQIQQEV